MVLAFLKLQCGVVFNRSVARFQSLLVALPTVRRIASLFAGILVEIRSRLWLLATTADECGDFSH